MKVFKFVYLIIGLGLFATAVIGKEKSENTPESLIQSLYSNHSEAKPFDLCNQKASGAFFDKNLLQLLAKDCKCKKKTGEVCKLSFDPLIGGQEFLESVLKPKIKKKDDKNFEVSIYDSNPLTISFELSRTGESYKIKDIKSNSGSLLNLLK